MTRRPMSVVTLLLTITLLRVDAQDIHRAGEELTINGLKVIVAPVASEVISVQLYLRGGCMNLTDSTQGMESFILECASKGSKGYRKERLNSILDRTAAVITSTSTKDFSCLNLRCLKSALDTLFDVLADLVLQPSFLADDVEMVRKNLLVEIAQRMDTPDREIAAIADESFHADHPYHLQPAGVKRSIEAITIDDMRQYVKDRFVTSRMLLVVVGDVDVESLRKKIESKFAALPKGKYVPVFPGPVVHSSSSLKIVEQQLPTNHIRGTFAMPGPRDPGYQTALVMMSILRSRVLEELGRKRGLSYMPTAGLANHLANHGYFFVTTANPDSALRLVTRELKKLQDEPVSAKDLKDQIAMFLTDYYLTVEKCGSFGTFLALHELSGMGWRSSSQFIDRVRSVSPADIQQLAREQLRTIQVVFFGDPHLINEQALAW